MLTFLSLLLLLALVAVAVVLALGVYSMARGGEFSRTWSNRLMQLRVAVQFAAILLLAAIVFLRGHPHH